MGRAASCDVHLLDDKVSREHCVFEPTEAGLTVRDLNSRNGTWVNGVRVVGQRRLSVEDTVGVGETLVLVSDTAEAFRASDGESTLVVSMGPVGSLRSAGAPDEDTMGRAGRLLLETAFSTDPLKAAQQFVDSIGLALRCDEVIVCRKNPEGQMRPLAASPRGASISLNLGVLETAAKQHRAVCVEEAQLRAKHDERTTTVVRLHAWVACAPVLPVASAVVAVVRSQRFESQELALLELVCRAAGPMLMSEAPSTPTESGPVIVAESEAMRAVVRDATRAASSTSTVLLLGESGSGKEQVARLIHAKSLRRTGPFVAVNCGAIPEPLAESELFGHERGAFTTAVAAHAGVFERADGGTLFLDEIGELSVSVQVKLLRVLEERLVFRVGGKNARPVDFRLIAATNRALDALVQAGTFREDLFYRLNVVQLRLAPLRERPEDILPMAQFFAARHAASMGRPLPAFSEALQSAIRSYRWPGNARQLSNAMERALVLQEGSGPLTLRDMPSEVIAPQVSATPRQGRTLGELVAALEREQIVLAMKRSRGVKTQASELLGISRPTLDRKLVEYAIDWISE